MDRTAALEAVLAEQQAGTATGFGLASTSGSGVTSGGRLLLVVALLLYLVAIAAATYVANGSFSYCRLDVQPPTFHVPSGMTVALVSAVVAVLCLTLPAIGLALSAFLGIPVSAGCGALLSPRSLGCIVAATLAIGAAVALVWPLLAVLRCRNGQATTTKLPDVCIWVSVGLAAAVAALLAHYVWTR